MQSLFQDEHQGLHRNMKWLQAALKRERLCPTRSELTLFPETKLMSNLFDSLKHLQQGLLQNEQFLCLYFEDSEIYSKKLIA
jgi:hypothetical protein